MYLPTKVILEKKKKKKKYISKEPIWWCLSDFLSDFL